MIARWLSCLALVAWPVPAHAHSSVPGIEGFYTGLLHPLSTPPQALLMLGLGLMAGGFDNKQARWPLGVFMAAMFIGLLISGVLEQTDIAMFATACVACALSALATGRHLLAAVAVAAVGGICIGAVSLSDPGQLRDRVITTLGAIVGANIGLLYIFVGQHFLRERYSWTWVTIAFRIAAAWIGAVSLLMLALLLAPEQA